MKIIPKFIIKNNKSGEEFKALDVYPTFPVYNGLGPGRQIKIVYIDDIERVKCVLNYDVINKYNNKQIIYDLNDSFDVYSIEENNTIKKSRRTARSIRTEHRPRLLHNQRRV